MYQAGLHDRRKNKGKHVSKNEINMLPDEDGQTFGLINKMLGNGRALVYCPDGLERVGRICGRMRSSRHKVLVEVGDLIIISGREFTGNCYITSVNASNSASTLDSLCNNSNNNSTDIVDIIHKYSSDETKNFIKHEMLPEKIMKIVSHSDTDDATGNVLFAD